MHLFVTNNEVLNMTSMLRSSPSLQTRIRAFVNIPGETACKLECFLNECVAWIIVLTNHFTNSINGKSWLRNPLYGVKNRHYLTFDYIVLVQYLTFKLWAYVDLPAIGFSGLN